MTEEQHIQKQGPWSAEEEELFAQLRADGWSRKQISARMHRSETSLSRKMERMDLPRKAGRFQPSAQPKAKKAGKTTLPPLPSIS
jgi:hypothetical protein